MAIGLAKLHKARDLAHKDPDLSSPVASKVAIQLVWC